MAPVSILLLLLLLLLTIGPRYAPYVAAQTENQPPPPPRVHNPKPEISPTMAIILICLISTFFLTCFFSIYVHRCINRQMTDSFTLFPAGTGGQGLPWRTEPRGLDPAVVAAFPTFIYSEVKELKIGKDVLECAVCLNEFEDDEALQLLPKCWHVFHPDCIQSWLNSHVTCPVCRADLMPEPIQTRRVPSPSRDLVMEPVIVRAVDDSMVRIQSPDAISAVGSSPKKVFPPISTSRKERRIRGEFRKSLSTGHSLVLPVENCERFTLRLPEEVRNRLVNTSLERAKSCHVVFPRARSSRKGFRSTSSGGNGLGGEFNEYERFDRNGRPHQWVFTATPPFFSRAGPDRSPVGHGDGGGPVRLLKSVASPLNRLFGRTNSRKVEVEVGERSSDALRAEDEV